MLTMQAFHARLFQTTLVAEPVLTIWQRLTQANLREVSVLKSTLAWSEW